MPSLIPRGVLQAAIALVCAMTASHPLLALQDGEQKARSSKHSMISPDNEPACASPVPPPLTFEQMEAYRNPDRQSPERSPALAMKPAPLRESAMPKHWCFLEVARRGQIDILFIGDSITDFFGRADRGQPVWNKHFATRKAVNFGISGDRTQDVLWRITNGELEGFSAKVIVLMIGTNNIGRNPNKEIIAGNAAIVEEIRKRQPQAKILLLGIFPRGNSPANPLRKSVREINAGLAELGDEKAIFYRDIEGAFLDDDGVMRDAVFVDGTHPSIFGYAIWVDAIEPTLTELLE